MKQALDPNLLLAPLTHLPARQLHDLARYYQTLALILEEHAAFAEQREDWRAAESKRQQALAGIPERVGDKMRAGVEESEALRLIAQELEVPEDTVRLRWKRSQQAARERSRRERDLEIMRLAARGWHNAAIARQLHVSPATVSRVVRANIQTAPARPLWRPADGHK